MSVVLASVAFWAAAQLILVGDLGKPEVVDFKVRFKRLKTSERKQLEADLRDKKITDKEFLDRLLVDWDLKDKAGEPVIYTEKQREELVEDWDGFEGALVRAYFENSRKAQEAAEVAKKLRAAVRHHYLSEGGSEANTEEEDADLRAQWQQLGVDPDQAMQAAQEAQEAPAEEDEQPGDFELPPEQWRAWEVFIACDRNWRVLIGIGLVHYDGIDNTAMESAMRILGVKPKHQRNVFWMVRVLESEARKFLNQR